MTDDSNKILASKNSVELVCAIDLEPEPICWVWDDWLAAGKFHILVGAPSTGKTTIALNIAAIITRGAQWPDGSTCQPGNVLIWSGEDNAQDTLLPRLLAHQADRNRIYFVTGVKENNKSRTFDPARDISKLYDKAFQIGEVQLIIVDPIVNVISGDSHKNGEVRRDLQPLVELGGKLKSVILGISHFTKGTSGRDPVERVTGSIAFGALARMVLVTANMVDENSQSKRLLVRAKSNHGPNGGGYYYQIEQVELVSYQGLFASQVIWGEAVEGDARTLLTEADELGSSEGPSVLSEAIKFLENLLSNGPVCKKEIEARAKNVGFKDITLRRAKNLLGVEALHEGYGKGSYWKWHLPSKMLKEAKDAPLNGVSIFEKL